MRELVLSKLVVGVAPFAAGMSKKTAVIIIHLRPSLSYSVGYRWLGLEVARLAGARAHGML
eukprot:SAG31_NODE_1270_length_9065_cov_7.007473_4_plen_61_part_00